MILYEVWYCDMHPDKSMGGFTNNVNVMARDISTAIDLVLSDPEKKEGRVRSVYSAKEINSGRCIMQEIA